MGAIASQITSLTIVFSTVYSDADQRKYQSSASLAFVQGIHRGPVNSPHKWPVTRKMFPFDDVIMDRLADSCVFCFWLHWCHMDVILSQITGNSTVCSTDRSSNDKWNGYICIYHNSVKLHGALWGESIGERCGFHSQMDSDAESVSMSCGHQESLSRSLKIELQSVSWTLSENYVDFYVYDWFCGRTRRAFPNDRDHFYSGDNDNHLTLRSTTKTRKRQRPALSICHVASHEIWYFSSSFVSYFCETMSIGPAFFVLANVWYNIWISMNITLYCKKSAFFCLFWVQWDVSRGKHKWTICRFRHVTSTKPCRSPGAVMPRFGARAPIAGQTN